MTRAPTVSKGKRRSAARLAAVQALYQLDVAGGVAEAVVGEFNRYRFGGEVDGQKLVEADPALFGELVLGVTRQREDIDARLREVLQGDWDFSSLELLMREILRAGAFEILMRPDIDPPLSISEYVDVAKSFFDKREPALINGILDRLARVTRPGEMETGPVAERPRRNEFERIAQYFAPLAAGFPGALGLTDDAAIIAPRPGNELVVTTDTIVAGVHYVGDEPPDLVAAKLLRVNLSDLAAKGAIPLAYTLNVALPGDIDDAWVEAFAAGLAADQAEFGIALIGGDSVSTPGPVTLTLTAFGEVPAGGALLRRNAHPGDAVFVTGSVGDGALGLMAARGRLDALDASDRAYLIDRYRRPRPRVALATGLRGLVHAAADVSDGLAADLGHIADTSGVAARINSSLIPLSPAAKAALHLDPGLLTTVLTGGDDYELVFTAPPSNAGALAELARDKDIPITELGRIVPGKGVAVSDASGRTLDLAVLGYRHG